MECILNKTTQGYLHEEPEIMVSTTISHTNDGKFSIRIINHCNKFVYLRRGCVIGQITPVTEKLKICSIDNLNNMHSVNNVCNMVTDNEFVNQVKVDEKHKNIVQKLLLKNKDIFAFSDNDLGTTDLAEAEIDTGEHKPINLRPYRIPLGQRQTFSDTIDEMLQAGIIRPSMSPWNFQVILVEKRQIYMA